MSARRERCRGIINRGRIRPPQLIRQGAKPSAGGRDIVVLRVAACPETERRNIAVLPNESPFHRNRDIVCTDCFRTDCYAHIGGITCGSVGRYYRAAML